MKNSRKILVSNMIAVIDLVVMFVAYALANKIKFGWFRTGILNPDTAYTSLFLIIIVAYFAATLFLQEKDNFMIRSSWREFTSVVKIHVYALAMVFFYLYITKTSENYSRAQLSIFFSLSILFCTVARVVVKIFLKQWYNKTGGEEKIAIVTTYSRAGEVIGRIRSAENWYFKIEGLALLDRSMVEEDVEGIEVLADRNCLMEKLGTEQIDSIFLCLDHGEEVYLPQNSVKGFVSSCCEMGKKVHVAVDEYNLIEETKELEMMGKYAVISYSRMNQRALYRIIKRCFDFIVGIFGCMLLTPVTLLASVGHVLEKDPGHTLIGFVRVGRNGRRYYQYHFRTLTRKGEKSIVGKVLCGLHLQNLPQAVNIVNGDMSVVGTKSPSLPEFMDYSSQARRTLFMKPGVLGFAPCKRRSELTERDLWYIENWSLGLDIRVLLETMIRTNRTDWEQERGEEEKQYLFNLLQEETPLILFGEWPDISGKQWVYRFFKRLVDIVVSGMGLVVLSPLFLVLALVIKGQDGGSVFYHQYRMGYHGKKVKMYKFRTMHMKIRNLEKILTPEQLEQYRQEFKINDDPRITSVGNFLRRTSLDELPQLYNVLKGELSLIGPRPIQEEELQYFGEDKEKLLSVKPGITGWWAAKARNNASYESGERQALELYYVEHQSFALDVKIVLKTIPMVLKGEGAK